MAKRTIVRLSDDIDGGEAVEQLTFALRGVEYEIDLSAKNVAALERVLAKYIAAGRKAKRGRGPARRSGPSSAKEDLAGIREWARANGMQVSNRGRISAEVRAAFDAAD
jgi:hypothetical protein